ncbi:MAG: HNH endonuclease [Candidatus Pacebacteria bacterium]|nr:HNH endonuclease [Candidatus Paceibacterota bacterium]MBP9832307.1 HNH endonuclease [Candidatus Paceibacterota bacterium]
MARANKKTCSRICANKNRAGIKYGTKRPYDKVRNERTIKLRVLEIRGGKCERCEYSKKQILHVHHKDRNHSNNSIQNLELICPNCHYEEHYLEKSWLNDTVQH